MLSFKKKVLLFLLIFINTFIQTYWSMFEFRNQLSSICLNECGYLGDAILNAFVFSFFIIIFFLLIEKIKISRAIKSLLKTLVTILIWFYINLTVFKDRESAWSTYSLIEELHYTFYYSSYAIIIMLIILMFLSNKIIEKK